MKKLNNILTEKIPAMLGMCLLLAVSQCFATQNYTFYQTGTTTLIVPGTDDIGNHCDNCVTNIELPFDYEFYGVTYNSANISSNGNIQFTGNNNGIPGSGLPNISFTNTIFVYSADLHTGAFIEELRNKTADSKVSNDTAEGGDPFNGKGIFTSISGVAPNRIFNIEWRAVFCCSNNNGAPDNNFELRLYEGQQKFDIIYGNITDDGSNITSGVQKDNTEFSLYQYNSPGTLSSGMSITTSLEPTDAQVVISGRLTTLFGEEITGARVTLTDSLGVSRTVLSGKFGNFYFKNVPSGAFYILSAKARGYRFIPQTLPVTEDITDIIFTPQP